MTGTRITAWSANSPGTRFGITLIFEYEIPKYDGGLGQPNLYVPIKPAVAERKIAHLLAAYGSQRARRWFSADTFMALMRLRGLECNAEAGLAEAFHLRRAHDLEDCR